MTDWREQAGRTLMIGVPGGTLDAALQRRIRALGPGGIILFTRNLESPEQTASLLASFRALRAGPSLLALDQEGGRVSRLEKWIGPTNTAADLARLGEPATRRFARLTADALRALGFNLDFAPVVDLCGPEAGNGIGSRSFGEEPVAVARLAGAFLEGLQATGVAGCLKHFPGLGDTSVDSHVELPTVVRSRERLRECDLEPFRALVGKAASVMVGHAHYPAVDGPTPCPASGSGEIVGGILRGELGFDGLVVSDDLEMGAVADRDREGAFAVQSIGAGCDLLLYCHTLERAEAAAESLAAEAAAQPDFGQRLRQAAARVDAAASRWQAPPPDLESWTAASRGFAALGDLA